MRLEALLWEYRNVPHEATGEKPSYVLLGVDCHTPTDAAFLPADPVTPVDAMDYRHQPTITLSNARVLAVKSVQAAQAQYKKGYDQEKKTQPLQYRVGDGYYINSVPT